MSEGRKQFFVRLCFMILGVFFTLLFRFIFFRESVTPDGILYWSYGKELAIGKYIWVKDGELFLWHGNTRLSLIFPLAVLVKIFGISRFTFYFMPYAEVILISIFLFLIVDMITRDSFYAFGTVLIYAFFPPFLLFDEFLYPDNLGLAGMLGGIYFALLALKGKHFSWYLSIFSFLVAIFAKIVSVIGILSLAMYMFFAYPFRLYKNEWKDFIIAQILLGVLVVLISYVVWNEPLGRIKGVTVYVNERFQTSRLEKSQKNEKYEIEKKEDFEFNKFLNRLKNVYLRIFRKMAAYFPKHFFIINFILLGGFIGLLIYFWGTKNKESLLLLFLYVNSFIVLNAFKLNPYPSPFISPQIRYFNYYYIAAIPGVLMPLLLVRNKIRNYIVFGSIILLFVGLMGSVSSSYEAPYTNLARGIMRVVNNRNRIFIDSLRTSHLVELLLPKHVRERFVSFLPSDKENCFIEDGDVIVANWFAISFYEKMKWLKYCKNILSLLDDQKKLKLLWFQDKLSASAIYSYNSEFDLEKESHKTIVPIISYYELPGSKGLFKKDNEIYEVMVENPYVLLYSGGNKIYKGRKVLLRNRDCLYVSFEYRAGVTFREKVMEGKLAPIFLHSPVRIMGVFFIDSEGKKIVGGRYFPPNKSWKKYVFPFCNIYGKNAKFMFLIALYGKGQYEFRNFSINLYKGLLPK